MASKGVGKLKSNVRQAYAALCEQTTKIFANPCDSCTVDVDMDTFKKFADPKKPFTFALVAKVTEKGKIDASTVYVTPVRDLSVTKPKQLNFNFGDNRVSTTFSPIIEHSKHLCVP